MPLGSKKFIYGPVVKLNNKVWNITRSAEKEVILNKRGHNKFDKKSQAKKYKIVAIEITKKHTNFKN